MLFEAPGREAVADSWNAEFLGTFQCGADTKPRHGTLSMRRPKSGALTEMLQRSAEVVPKNAKTPASFC